MSTHRWNIRYDRPDYLFGTEPSQFLREQADRIPAGARVLCVADGEGRNSVYLAGLGHEVTAFDPSSVALDKARALAAERGVSVEFHRAGVEDWDWSRQFDAVVAIFVQFAPPQMRDRMFADMVRALAPGGVILLHGYTPRQVAYGTGGPSDPTHLYTREMLRGASANLDILRLEAYERDVDEGRGHSGRSALIDLVARRPARSAQRRRRPPTRG